jgi:hypothetical protein
MVRPYKPHSEQTHIQIHQGHNWFWYLLWSQKRWSY